MTDGFPLWAQLLYNEPLAISALKNEVLCQAAEARISGRRPERIDAHALDMVPRASADEASFYSESGRKPFQSKDGLAVIKVFGSVVKRGGFMDAESGLIGYDHVLRQVRAAYNDPEISGTFIMFDSPGGHVSRLFEAANEIATMTKAEGGKPIYAYLDEQACSAAYVLASPCDAILGPRSSMAGSLGVILNLMDTSKLHEKVGIKPIVIRSSFADLKARPQAGEEITEEALDGYVRLVEDASDQLTEFVSAMRGISDSAIRDMRGEVFSGSDLIRLGLADEICSEREAWALLKEEARS